LCTAPCTCTYQTAPMAYSIAMIPYSSDGNNRGFFLLSAAEPGEYAWYTTPVQIPLTHSDPSLPRTRPDSQGVSKGIRICATPHQFWDAHIPIESGVRGRFSIFQSHGNQAPGKKPRLQYEVPPGSFKDRRRQFRILLNVQYYGNTHGRSGPGNITPAAGRVAGGHP
jgi:hypothetical protein